MLDVRNFQINTVSKQKGGKSKDDWDVGYKKRKKRKRRRNKIRKPNEG